MEKELLEELIQQKETVYLASSPVKGIQLSPDTCKVILNYLCIGEPGKVKQHYLDWIFETKEDAEEARMFGDIERVEQLNFPNWKELKKLSEDTLVKFNDIENKFYYELVRHDNTIIVAQYSWGNFAGDIVFEEPLTRANYDKARQYCADIFQGREV